MDQHAPSSKLLMALYVWHKEWAKIARAVIKQRDLPIRLGLAKRKARSGNGGTGGAGGTG